METLNEIVQYLYKKSRKDGLGYWVRTTAADDTHEVLIFVSLSKNNMDRIVSVLEGESVILEK